MVKKINEKTRLPELTKEEWESAKAEMISDDQEYDSFITSGITTKDIERLVKSKKDS